MTRLIAAAGGFLLAVLWLDLMFDVQMLADPVSERAVASIAAYYRRVTVDSYPMANLVSAVMSLTIAGVVWQLIWGRMSLWLRIASLVLGGGPIVLAGARVLPNAMTLAVQAGSFADQSELARTILFDHVVCFAAIGAFVLIEVVAGGES